VKDMCPFTYLFRRPFNAWFQKINNLMVLGNLPNLFVQYTSATT
jgi:hypothetical protein